MGVSRSPPRSSQWSWPDFSAVGGSIQGTQHGEHRWCRLSRPESMSKPAPRITIPSARLARRTTDRLFDAAKTRCAVAPAGVASGASRSPACASPRKTPPGPARSAPAARVDLGAIACGYLAASPASTYPRVLRGDERGASRARSPGRASWSRWSAGELAAASSAPRVACAHGRRRCRARGVRHHAVQPAAGREALSDAAPFALARPRTPIRRRPRDREPLPQLPLRTCGTAALALRRTRPRAAGARPHLPAVARRPRETQLAFARPAMGEELAARSHVASWRNMMAESHQRLLGVRQPEHSVAGTRSEPSLRGARAAAVGSRKKLTSPPRVARRRSGRLAGDLVARGSEQGRAGSGQVRRRDRPAKRSASKARRGDVV